MIKITEKAWSKLSSILDHMKKNMGNYEVQGFGRIEFQGKEVFLTDVDIPKQEAQMAHIKTTPEDLLEWRAKRFNLGQSMTDEDIEHANNELKAWRLWWHSHPGMTPTYSSTDFETLADLAEESGDWFLGLCIDDDMDNNVYVCYNKPIPTEVLKFGVKATLHREPNPELEELYKKIEELESLPDMTDEADNLIKENVSKKAWGPTAECGSSGPRNDKKGSRNFTTTYTDSKKHPLIHKTDVEDGTFLHYLVDKEAVPLKRGCETCMGMIVEGREVWKTNNNVITFKAGVTICVDCDIEEELCLCLEDSFELWQLALDSGWVKELPEHIKARLEASINAGE